MPRGSPGPPAGRLRRRRVVRRSFAGHRGTPAHLPTEVAGSLGNGIEGPLNDTTSGARACASGETP